MIVYERLWKTMDQKNITTYQLINKYHFSKGQIDRLKRNANIEMITINNLCRVLKCRIEDIAEYVEDESV
ncbi:helix-turn-helix domain-containing protein [Anaerocolumna sp.]|uniref:helix-turn-helix domain-containing protein n=1 Tax=Anaerocolumna sp. TaxID=2041569 RepID=UPI0028AC8917|nr:helix-turn-helix transcriptional regulator [Anaerocolumna sp.]